MDGASKFVRGDAIAGMMILAINLIGGVCIGIFKYNLSADAAFQQYVLMTIGDGLVAQIRPCCSPPQRQLSSPASATTAISPMTCATSCWQAVGALHRHRDHVCAGGGAGDAASAILLFSALLGFTGWRMSKRPQAAEAEEKASKR
ncbi:hypothetical protein ECZU29_05030 [Escherichia coli]|nr:hypothetical protein ECZU29_05030 [Escherichia coli]